MVRLTDRPDMISAVFRGRKTTTTQQQQSITYRIYLAIRRHILSLKVRQQVREKNDGLRLLNAVLNIQGFSNPHCSYGHKTAGTLTLIGMDQIRLQGRNLG